MEATRTTAAIQGYLDALAGLRGDSPAEPVVRSLLGRAAGRLHKLCASLLYRSYPRLTRAPLNLESAEMLSAGEFQLALDPESPAEAEASFRQAVTIARRHQAKSGATGHDKLARLWQRQGRADEGRAALAAVFDTFTEGFTTPDLVDAAAQLKSLP